MSDAKPLPKSPRQRMPMLFAIMLGVIVATFVLFLVLRPTGTQTGPPSDKITAPLANH